MESCRSIGSGTVVKGVKSPSNARLPCALKKKESERHRICEECRVIATDAIYLVIMSVSLETCRR